MAWRCWPSSGEVCRSRRSSSIWPAACDMRGGLLGACVITAAVVSARHEGALEEEALMGHAVVRVRQAHARVNLVTNAL